jgi:hypothetical protein
LFSDPFIWHDDGATAGNDGGGGMMSSKGMAGTGPNRSDRAAEPMVPLPLARAFFERAKLPSAVLSAVLRAVIGAVRSGSREGTDRKEKREKESKMEKAHHTDAKVEEEQMGLGRGAWFLACKLIGLAQQQMQQQMQQQEQKPPHGSSSPRPMPPAAAAASNSSRLTLAALVAMAPAEEAAVVAGVHVWPTSMPPKPPATNIAAAESKVAPPLTGAGTPFCPLPDFHIALGPAPPPPATPSAPVLTRTRTSEKVEAKAEAANALEGGGGGVRRPRPTTGKTMPLLDVCVHSPRLVDPRVEEQQNHQHQQHQHRHEQQFRNHRHHMHPPSTPNHDYHRAGSGFSTDDDDDDVYDTATTMEAQRTMNARTTSFGSHRSSHRSYSSRSNSSDDVEHRDGTGQDATSASDGGWRGKLKSAAVAVTHVAESAASAAAAIANRGYDRSGSSGDYSSSGNSSGGSTLNSAALAYVNSYARGSGREGGAYTAYALYTRTSLPWYPKSEVRWGISSLIPSFFFFFERYAGAFCSSGSFPLFISLFFILFFPPLFLSLSLCSYSVT